MAEEIEEISNEEKLQIAQHYLLSSPPSQFREVLTDVRKLLPDELLTDVLATGIARVYNTKNGKVVTTPSGNKVVVCSAGEVDATHYVDPVNGLVFGINHLTLETSEDPVPTVSDETLETVREAFQQALTAYAANQFSPVETAAGAYCKDGKIILSITSEQPNLRNFWSGKWSSTWTVNPETSTISGEIKIHAHYFEDGNVQLQTTKTVPETSLSGDLVSSAIAHIQTTQTAIMDTLVEMFGSMNSHTLKAMRRAQTITQTKFEWNKAYVDSVNQIRAKKP